MQSVITKIMKEQYPRIFAGLYALFRDIDLVEDGIQDASERAIEVWVEAMPKNPEGWLYTVARNRILDSLKRTRRNGAWPEDWEPADPSTVTVGGGRDMSHDRLDEQLRLMCLCCHPALNMRTQTLLTLKLVGGLTVGEIAAALVMKPKTVAQYLTRAKAKIGLAGIPFSVPDESHLPSRTEAIRQTIYLLFNEGYHSNSNHSLYRVDLCNEAIRLCRLLCQLPKTGQDSLALLALMLFQHSRSPARERSDGQPILLQDQDRRLWKWGMIREAESILRAHFSTGDFESAHLYRAAIAWEYGKSPNFAGSNWERICFLYSRLYVLNPDPIVLLAWLGAESYHRSPKEALALMHQHGLEDHLSEYRWFYSVRAELRKRCGDSEGARQDLRRALELAENPGERLLLQDRLGEAVGL